MELAPKLCAMERIDKGEKPHLITSAANIKSILLKYESYESLYRPAPEISSSSSQSKQELRKSRGLSFSADKDAISGTGTAALTSRVQ